MTRSQAEELSVKLFDCCGIETIIEAYSSECRVVALSHDISIAITKFDLDPGEVKAIDRLINGD